MARFPKPGTILLGKYRVLSLIGEGGMGAVLKARHIDLDEDVAIKCLLPHHLEREDIVRRFLREAKAAVKLKGKHVARVLDVGRLDTGVPYIVMEYLEGADLNAIIKHHGAQDPAVAVDLMLQACEAIAEAHSIGIIHRDIKASNFFVSQPENQAPHLKVLDFGIATAPEGTSDLTNTQSVIGTPAYMAPEQMRSSKTSDARSDIWSLGVVAYELLEGQRPFRSDVYSELCLKVGMDPPHPITNPNVPEGLTAIVMRCLEKPVEKRYQTVADFARDLVPFASDPVFAHAYAEQATRLLGGGRRGYGNAYGSTGSHDIAPHDRSDVRAQMTPGSLTPGNLTPAPTLLGHPTPTPSPAPKTPTSIHDSNGQMAPVIVAPARSRGMLIAVVATSIVAIGAVALLAMGRGNSKSAAAGATEPVKIEPATPEPETDDTTKSDTTKSDTTKTDTPKTSKTESAKTESAKTESAKAESVKTESAKTESAKTESAKADMSKTDTSKTDTSKTDTTKADTTKADATKTDTTKTETTKTETTKADTTKTEAMKADTTKTETTTATKAATTTKTNTQTAAKTPPKKIPPKKDPPKKDPPKKDSPKKDDGDIYGKRE